MQVRPARNFGRPRRGVSRYGTQSLGRIRTEAWGPPFRPTLASIPEEPLAGKPQFCSPLDIIAEEPIGPLLLPPTPEPDVATIQDMIPSHWSQFVNLYLILLV